MTSALPTARGDDYALSTETGLSGLCKAAADGLRLRVLRLLRRDAMDVSELCDVLDVRQPALSHHLKILSSAGLLSSERDGNHIFYRRREVPGSDPQALLRQALFTAADALPLDRATDTRRRALQRQREQNSRDFFRLNAERFREQQDLIAGPERYSAAVGAMIRDLPPASRALAIEVGPGEGWLLPTLGDLYHRVVALDNAPAMLDSARRAAQDLENIDFLLGDTSHPSLKNMEADLVIINMVLHHTPDPRATLLEAAAALAPGGRLLLTELCEHRQGWARENCGDLWLGFDPERIGRWAADAKLQELASSYLGQRNGFKLQVRLFAAPASAPQVR